MAAKLTKEFKRFIKKQFKRHIFNYEDNIEENVWADIWKQYYFENHSTIEDKLSILKENLDEESIKTIDNVFERYVFMLPSQKYKKAFLCNKHEFFTKEEINGQNQKIKIDKEKYKLPQGIYYETSIFQYGHGLKLLPENVLEYIKDKDFIDGGAFVGDSAIFMNGFTSGKVHSFEPDRKNFALLQETIGLNRLEDKIIPYELGIADENKEIKVYSSVFCNSVLQTREKSNPIIINTTSIDNFVKNNAITIGLIKLDVEGNEFEAIQGAINTINEQKPVLLISVYHHPKDFLEIKPLIESLNLDYKFMVKKLNDFSPTYETMLICLPESV